MLHVVLYVFNTAAHSHPLHLSTDINSAIDMIASESIIRRKLTLRSVICVVM